MITTLIKIANYLNTNKQNLPVIYLAGKVTGLDYNQTSAKFKGKQAELQARGFFVLNPMDFIEAEADWKSAMRIAVILLASAKHIFLLPDWFESDGATLERNLSLPLGINVMED